MALNLLLDFYKQTVSTAWSAATGKQYVSVKPTIGVGILVLSPSSATLREIIRYTSTGTDGGGDYVITSARGLGGTTAQTHQVGEVIRMNFTAEHWSDLDAVITAIIASGAPDASTSVKGVSKLSAIPVSATAPITVGDNDPRIFPNSYGVDSGSTDDYSITLTTAPTAYVTGQVYAFKANTANTGAATLNINGLGVKTIVSPTNTTLTDGYIAAGEIVMVMYDGTSFRVLKPSLSAASPTRQTFLVSGTYTPPANLKYARVRGVGIGGNGGVDPGNPSGGGGGAGAYGERLLSAAQIGASQTVTMATTPGTNTSFGALLVLGGGTSASGASPGVGGTATGGDLNVPGQNGMQGPAIITSGGLTFSGQGGASLLGPGGQSTVNTSATATAAGQTPTGYGGGGSGSCPATDGNPANGTPGNGAPPILIIDEFYG